jgi:RHS repeat-associated protein
MKRCAILLLVGILNLMAAAKGYAATDWSAQDYDLYAGDFNGDGKADVLYIAKDPSKASGIALSDGTGPNIPFQSWPANYLGIPWYGNHYTVIVADFNGDGHADVLLQSNTPGDSYLLQSDSHGNIIGITQTIANSSAGVVWSADQHHIIAGDFNHDGRADLFLQATSPTGLDAVLLSDPAGTFPPGGSPVQSWTDSAAPGGFKWSTQNSLIYAGDFNGDGYTDLLIQARPVVLLVAYDPPIPVPTYPPNMNGVALAQPSGAVFQTAGVQQWSRFNNGVDWSPLTTHIVTGSFTATSCAGCSDVLLQANTAGKASYVLSGNSTGAVFSAGTALASNVQWSADTNRIIAANFAGAGHNTGVYLQTLTPAGTNSTATDINGSSVTTTPQNPATSTGVVPAGAVGRTPGSFSVSSLGSATYSIPVVVPPGVAKVQPSVSFVYHSGAPNGLLGVGWSIGGLSEIERCKKTLDQDSVSAAVTLTTSDVFCINGNKLRLTNSVSYGADGSTYQTELDEFSRITAHGSAGNGPAYFTVEGKNGLLYEYGNTADSRIESLNPAASTTPRTWALDKVSDRAGNTMTIQYQKDGSPNGAFRPLQIDYTSNSTAGLAAVYRVAFVWDTRPAADNLSGYVAGGLVRETNRLNRIETQYNDPTVGGYRLVRKYQLSYNTSGSTPRSRLEAVQECDRNSVCMPATIVSWQSGTAAIGTDNSLAAGSNLFDDALPIDINGDGRSDLVYPIANPTTGAATWNVATSNGTGYGAATPTSVTGTSLAAQYLSALPIDFNGDGLMDLVWPSNGGTWQVLQSNGSTLVPLAPTTFTAPNIAGKAWVTDIDGDGLQDLIYLTDNQTLAILKNTGGSFTSLGTVAPLGTNATFNTIASLTNKVLAQSSIQVADFNGDGLADLIVSWTVVTGTAQSGFSTQQSISVLYSTGSSYVLSGTPIVTLTQNLGGINNIFNGMRVADFNGDGNADLLYPCFGTTTWCVRFGSASGLGAEINTQIQQNADPSTGLANAVTMDWDGDGKDDIVETGSAGGAVQVSLATGDNTTPFAALFPTSIPNPVGMRVVDINGDGVSDLSYLDSSGNWHYRLRSGPYPDLVSGITDGLGNSVNLTYAPISDSSVYTAGSPLGYPYVNVTEPLYVVKNVLATDGVGGTYNVSEAYAGARLELKGRGFVGFATRKETDGRTGISTTWTYRQDFPFIGQVQQETVQQPNNGATIKQTINNWTSLSLSGLTNAQRWFPFVLTSVRSDYEVGGTANGQQVSQTTTTSGYDNFGNLDDVDIVTKDVVSTQQYETHKTLMFFTDSPTWCTNLVTQEDEFRFLPDGSQGRHRTTYAPDTVTANCRIKHRTVEPNVAALTVNTDFGYDTFGNINSSTITATGLATRTTTSNYGPQGVLPVSSTNGENEPAGNTYDYALGVPLTATDASGVQTIWTYDGFGRRINELRPDGTSTSWTYSACVVGNGYCGDAQLRYQIYERRFGVGNALLSYALQMFDSWGRVKYDQAPTISGAPSVVQTIYDALGRIYQKSPPYFAGFSPSFVTYSYDLLDRPLSEQRRISDANSGSQTTQYSYGRLTQSVTDANGHATTKIFNVISQVSQVTDAASGSLQYVYDAFGNLRQTTDPNGNHVVSTYDARGNKLTMDDPDLGHWVYSYYPTGELMTQTDANNNQTTFTYDRVSRPKTRVEPEGTTTWSYGLTAAARDVGKLTTVTSPGGYGEVHSYDLYGRPQDVSTTIDGTAYVISNAYDPATGYLSSVTYPTSTAAVANSRFKVAIGYQNGIMQSITDANSPATVYWQQIATNAMGQGIDAQYGNGLHTFSTYDSITGLLANRFTGASSQIQNLSYQWDKVGNLTERKDAGLVLTEDFLYDSLNRMYQSTLNTVINLSVGYDALGNITSKSDIGTATWTYDINHKHAVSTAGSHSYTYDANGNIKTRDGSSLTWASYNLPTLINQGTNSAQLFYGASRARYKQISTTASGGNLPAGTETTLYVGNGMFEKVTKPGGVIEYKHYIFGGKELVAIRTLRSNSVNDTRYLHLDHLGGVDTITNESGAIVVKLSFDAFGKRRSPTSWGASPSSSDWTNIAALTHRGFTSQEGLDNVGLIHMNGRVYDPLIGRFLSADPVIQVPLLLQSYNRYSYVLNNPLSLVDPTGYSWLSSLFHAIGHFLSRYWRPIVAIIAVVITYGQVADWIEAANLAAGAPAALDAGEWVVVYAASGLVGGAITGGFEGAVTGAITGAMFGLVAGIYGNSWTFGRFASSAVAGGLSSEISGGSFTRGAELGLALAAIQWGAYQMRESMIEQSQQNEYGLNESGTSSGWNGDHFKLGGARAADSATSIGQVDVAPFGGAQGGPGYLAGVGAYSSGSWEDSLIESFAGPHDWLSSLGYNAAGNAAAWTQSGLGPTIFNVYSGLALFPAAAIVGASTAPEIVITRGK